jgi:hypothetical protein
MDGHVTATSAAGAGARFSVRLPAHVAGKVTESAA